jgi:predicted ABC-type ATPase
LTGSRDREEENPDLTIIIIVGPNGEGKTTFAREFLQQEANCLTFISADLITEGVKRGESSAIETIFSGRACARMIPRFRDLAVVCEAVGCVKSVLPFFGGRA